MKLSSLYTVFFFVLLLAACQQKPNSIETPWGEMMAAGGELVGEQDVNGVRESGGSIDAIRNNGEMIMLTVYGPETYYDYHGHGMGVNYLMCEKLSEQLGVHLRVDVCRDTLDMINRLKTGEGDIIAVPLRTADLPKGTGGASNDADAALLANVANGWVVLSKSDLVALVKDWYKPQMLAEMKKQEQYMLSVASITRKVNPWMMSASKGQISVYDGLFRKYAAVAGVDWMLLAAQCYQESCFDPKAHSWAGACGLMQIMPATADHLSLPRERLYDAESNIASGARYMRELQQVFSDVANPRERLCFALAAYNGGSYHVRDAMALTKKYGGVPQRWSDVRRFILLLSDPAYYNDPVVKNGYMRGSETAQYVDMIMQRHSQYRNAIATGAKVSSVVKSSASHATHISPMESTPHRAAKKNKWR